MSDYQVSLFGITDGKETVFVKAYTMEDAIRCWRREMDPQHDDYRGDPDRVDTILTNIEDEILDGTGGVVERKPKEVAFRGQVRRVDWRGYQIVGSTGELAEFVGPVEVTVRKIVE